MRLLLRLRGSFLPAGPVRLQGAVRRTGGRDLDFACHLRAVGRSSRSERSTYLQAARESIGTSRYRESHVAIRRMTDKASLYGNPSSLLYPLLRVRSRILERQSPGFPPGSRCPLGLPIVHFERRFE